MVVYVVTITDETYGDIANYVFSTEAKAIKFIEKKTRKPQASWNYTNGTEGDGFKAVYTKEGVDNA